MTADTEANGEIAGNAEKVINPINGVEGLAAVNSHRPTATGETEINGHGQQSELPPHPGLLDQWHSQPRKLRIIHVGAGATGLCAAFKMERQLTDYELVCYEKNPEIGGTWPAHIYTYTFEPNPKWKSYYAYAPEIQQYFMDFCEKYQLRKYIKLEHKVIGATWHEEKGQWEVKIEHDGQILTDWAHILMNGSGFLNRWRWPEIDGLHSFKGALMHSAAWNDTVDLKDKRVALLGTGSSAIQILPQVQQGSPKCFSPSNTWISPPMPRVPVELTEGTKATSSHEEVNPDVSQAYYKAEEVQRFIDDPEYHLQYRKQIEHGINVGFAIFYKDSQASQIAKEYMVSAMKRRLQDNPELCKRLIPDWPVGCRRLTPGDGYLEALIKSNVDPVYAEITAVVPEGLCTEDGAFHEVDVIICATGFDMAWTPHFDLVGTHGQRLKDAWQPHPNSYLGIAAPGFPNYWVMNGPRGALCNGTVLPCFETQVEYAIAAAKKIQSEQIHSLSVKDDVTRMLNRYVDKWQEGSVWTGECKSWYKNNTVNGKVMCWGGSSMHYLKTIKTPRWEHYDIRYVCQ
ncbi:uncharacterized protein A1O9_03027 [Exophiala aquamarina CBS 119918]|uniref:Cyclohexanone monooxygenase n=1 Tax=Exophiala aquamarina CBS 119918 TaxID=1182545 RepID=A0A072PNJ3_9EURO|nr:uncharacterized protein A1O9_03027 [Exophiala aquamarina CBS 119918]KEF61461.1 hypothetical protein A1O9_03027 [Exophiala aquamarina CBS 119918]